MMTKRIQIKRFLTEYANSDLYRNFSEKFRAYENVKFLRDQLYDDCFSGILYNLERGKGG